MGAGASELTTDPSDRELTGSNATERPDAEIPPFAFSESTAESVVAVEAEWPAGSGGVVARGGTDADPAGVTAEGSGGFVASDVPVALAPGTGPAMGARDHETAELAVLDADAQDSDGVVEPVE